MVTVAAGGLAVFVLSMAAMVTLGAADEPRRVAPAVNSYTVEHGLTSADLPGADPAAELAEPIVLGR
jgi:hypothetical protein